MQYHCVRFTPTNQSRNGFTRPPSNARTPKPKLAQPTCSLPWPYCQPPAPPPSAHTYNYQALPPTSGGCPCVGRGRHCGGGGGRWRCHHPFAPGPSPTEPPVCPGLLRPTPPRHEAAGLAWGDASLSASDGPGGETAVISGLLAPAAHCCAPITRACVVLGRATVMHSVGMARLVPGGGRGCTALACQKLCA